MRAGTIALTALGLMAFVVAIAAACAAILTALILSPTAARVGGRSTTRYGSTFAETLECSAMALMALRPRSRAPASFLLVSCFFKASTALRKIVSQWQKTVEPWQSCDRGKRTMPGTQTRNRYGATHFVGASCSSMSPLIKMAMLLVAALVSSAVFEIVS